MNILLSFFSIIFSVLFFSQNNTLPLLNELLDKKFHIEKLKNDKQENFDLKNLNGKPTLINVWFTRCQPCIHELPFLNKLEEKWNSKVNFVAITFDSQDEIQNFLLKHTFNYYHLNTGFENLEKFGIYKYPLNFVLDKNGNIKKIYGGIDVDSFLSVEKDFENLL